MNHLKTYEIFNFFKRNKEEKKYPSKEEKEVIYYNCEDIFYELEDLGYQVEIKRVYDMGFRTESGEKLKDKMIYTTTRGVRMKEGTPMWNAIEVIVIKPIDEPVRREQEFWKDVFPLKKRFINYLESLGFKKRFQHPVNVIKTSDDGMVMRYGGGSEIPINGEYALVSKFRWSNEDWTPIPFFN